MEVENYKIFKSLKKTVITDFQEKKKGQINPVIVTFQNGELNADQASEFNVVLTAKESGGTNIEVETSDNHVFKDSNCNETSGIRQIIAIRNTKTNKMKLVEVDSAILINSALLKLRTENTIPSDYGKDLSKLNKTFGGKKIVSRLQQREKLNINSHLIADEIKEAVAEIKVENTVSSTEKETDSIIELLPPCHREARILHEVYKINEILTEDELESLKEEVTNKILDSKKLNLEEYSQFFKLCFEEAQKSKDDLQSRLAGILFTETLINFIKIPARKLMQKNVVLCPFSSVIHTKLLNEFCNKTENSITRPLTMKDKSLCYIIALCLICCNYQINLKVLATVTSIHLNKLVQLARVVGAVPLAKDQQVFVLKVPLPALPKTSKGKKFARK